MQTRHQVAMLAAGLLVGAQLGIASIGLPIPDTDQHMEPVPPEAQVLESDTASAPEAVSTEPGAIAEESAPAPVTTEHVVQAAAPQPEAAYVSPFPPSTDDVALLPALIAYLDSTAHLRLTGASGEVFPRSTDDHPLLPAVVAYFDRLEATRLAAQAQQLARSEGASSSSAATDLATNRQEVVAPAGQTSTQGIAALDSG
jgi:hypothetical protein